VVKHAPEKATVRIGVASAVPTVLRSLGADPAKVVAEAGFDLEVFEDPDNLISYAARGRLLSRCVARTGCKHFGLLLGQQGRLSSFGLVGFLVQHSPDVGTALGSLVRYLHLHVRGAVPSLTVHGKSAVLGYDIYEPQVEATDQIGDGAVAVMLNIMRTLCGPDWKPTEALFAHRKPEDAGPFRRFFRAPLRFNAEQNALVFPAAWLAHSLSGADPELHRMLQKQIDALEVRHREDFPEQVRSVLRSALLTGHAKADQVATLFSMHSRTLSRRLSAFGTNFQELVDEGRFEIARQMLEDSAMEVSQIAASLDYADASAFTRAFRRWSGTTPALWRAKRS
jgi:AraC-like DNA-binding protein